MSTSDSTEPVARAPRLSVSVYVEYYIDPRGTARVKDEKTLRNDGLADAALSSEFKQAINHNVSSVKVTDSRSSATYPWRIIRGDDHHQVAIEVAAPHGGPYMVEAGTQRTLILEYEMSEATTILGDGSELTFLIKNRFGSVTYRYEFATIEYRVVYHISKPTIKSWWQGVFLKSTLLQHPLDMIVREDATHFHVEYQFSLDLRQVKYVHLVLKLKPRYWLQWAVMLLVGAVASAAVATAPAWLRIIAGLFDG